MTHDVSLFVAGFFFGAAVVNAGWLLVKMWHERRRRAERELLWRRAAQGPHSFKVSDAGAWGLRSAEDTKASGLDAGIVSVVTEGESRE